MEATRPRQNSHARRRRAASSTRSASYERGYKDGYRSATRDAADVVRGLPRPARLNADELRALVTLCHPDRHPPERSELANRATAKLLELLEDERA